MMEDNQTREVLVVDTLLEKHLLGIINDADISEKSLDQNVDASSLNAEQCMKPLFVTAKDTATLEECERLLDAHHLERLAIVDEAGHLCGIFDRSNMALASTEIPLEIH